MTTQNTVASPWADSVKVAAKLVKPAEVDVRIAAMADRDIVRPAAGTPTATPPAFAKTVPVADGLDELKDIDFLLEDIEDKIAPLALALTA